jgi:hypothetical protein
MTRQHQLFGACSIILLVGCFLVFRSVQVDSANSVARNTQNAIHDESESSHTTDEPNALEPREPPSISDVSREFAVNKPGYNSEFEAIDKRQNLSKAREARPIALTDHQITATANPEQQQRYSMRAARAERLNQRLRRRISTLNSQLTSAPPGEQARIKSEIERLRDNQFKREALENAAYPMQIQRPNSY